MKKTLTGNGKIFKQSESTIQQHSIRWLKYQYPQTVFFSIPNEGRRTFANASRLKAQGLVSGVADICIARPNKSKHALFIEFKGAKGKQSPEQKEFQKNVEQCNYQYNIVKSLDEFMKIVNDYFFDI